MKAKLGVCVGYSNIMVDACKSVGIMSEVVGGNVYPNDKEGDAKPYGHAWVIVKINGKYGLIDPTWG
jgi:transglutaminase/protease-like cytokinesis protein 3